MVRLSFQLKRLRLLGIGGLGLLISVAIALGPIALPAPATTEPSTIAITEPVEPGIDPLAAGRTYYQAGQFAVAIEQWQTAVQQASLQGDLARQIMGWNSIASAQQVLNHWDQAHQSVEHSRALLETSDGAEPILWAQTLNTQASLLLTQGCFSLTAVGE